ncbi:Oidioi.mRNA.OKI2018_I69.chr2.g8099.t2.cds [Oikopleura dioica]|nr:Oidioi.mRNA.OKI2018_I69.chr2.g8099.t2.cds [Oikopleura dioica]
METVTKSGVAIAIGDRETSWAKHAMESTFIEYVEDDNANRAIPGKKLRERLKYLTLHTHLYTKAIKEQTASVRSIWKVVATAEPLKNNETIKCFSGTFSEINDVVAKALPRAEAAGRVGMAYLYAEEVPPAYKPLVITYRAGHFMRLNVRNRTWTWTAIEAGLTGGIENLVEGERGSHIHFRKANEVVILAVGSAEDKTTIEQWWQQQIQRDPRLLEKPIMYPASLYSDE